MGVLKMNAVAQTIQEKQWYQLMDLPYNTNNTSDPTTLDPDEEKNEAIDTVLLLNFSNSTFLEEVEKCTDFSKYIIHPLKLPYTKFHLAITICFKFLSDFMGKSNQEKVKEARKNILQGTNEKVFAPTVTHLLPKKSQQEQQEFQTFVHETNSLDHYKPYNPQDQLSKQNLRKWINYPGLLKLTRMARQLHRLAEEKEKRNTARMIQLANILTKHARILARTQVGPITSAMSIAAIKTAVKHEPTMAPMLKKLINGEDKIPGDDS